MVEVVEEEEKEEEEEEEEEDVEMGRIKVEEVEMATSF